MKKNQCLLILALFILLCSCQSGIIGGADGPTAIFVSSRDSVKLSDEELSKAQDLENRIVDAILSSNASKYLSGECAGEGHIILGGDDDNKIIYALTMYGEYGFQNANFVKVSGTGIIPMKITFDDDGNLLNTETPKDGSEYVKSVKELFPKKYHNLILKSNDSNYNILKEQEIKYAEKYLKKIGRNAIIGEYGDFEHPLLTKNGVSVEVSNALLANKDLARYPMWIGSQEYIEDGIRYVYTTDVTENVIHYAKTEYDTRKVIERFKFDAKTGYPIK